MQHEHDESKLPRWVKQRLKGLRETIAHREKDLERLRQAHLLLTTREWYTMRRPPFTNIPPDEPISLYALTFNTPHYFMTLHPGQIILIGHPRSETDLEVNDGTPD